MAERSQDAASERWSHRHPQFNEALQLRLKIIVQEAHDKMNTLRFDREQHMQAYLEATRGINQGEITRSRNLLNAAEDHYKMSLEMWEQRLAWLQQSGENLLSLTPKGKFSGVIRVK